MKTGRLCRLRWRFSWHTFGVVESRASKPRGSYYGITKSGTGHAQPAEQGRFGSCSRPEELIHLPCSHYQCLSTRLANMSPGWAGMVSIKGCILGCNIGFDLRAPCSSVPYSGYCLFCDLTWTRSKRDLATGDQTDLASSPVSRSAFDAIAEPDNTRVASFHVGTEGSAKYPKRLKIDQAVDHGPMCA